ncbi:phosphate transport system protein [Methanohalophilus levihalophilus]|uniref:phosphate signaling complex protein PhoU n=1 Tax=Methanohalophilus levihalophilus TaxID=1431282 RepID=UPI001AE928A8|nr:phosphate signaling complex protein PhoU [Methanohalophilus levihalophilus]MBP2029330.1 phosphate transport system protein [Methanohalophilus levihalophilus]
MVREKYLTDLKHLKQNVIEMGHLSMQMIDDAQTALKNVDKELAGEIVMADEVVDNYEYKIEKRSADLLALQQPMAKDLRLIITSYKISIDLERMSDMAVDIAQIVRRMDDEIVFTYSDLDNIFTLCREMVANTIKAYEEGNVELARKTAESDDLVDQKFYKGWETLVRMMISNSAIIQNATDLMFVIRYLERIADHSCNICESIIYMHTGERVDLN